MRPSRPDAGLCKALRRLGWLLVGVLALGCDAGSGGLPDSDEASPYRFIKSKGMMIRIDTSHGQVWYVPSSGDGGWIALGSQPSAEGQPSEPGRYAIYNLQSSGQRGMRRDAPQRLLRMDRLDGRTWTVEVIDGAEWTRIAEDGEPTFVIADRSVTEIEKASPPVAPSEKERAGRLGRPPGHREVPEIMPAERFGETTEEQAKNAEVVLKALDKEGLPLFMKVWGAKQLAVLDPEIAVPPLLEALNSEHPEVVVAAIESLQQIGQASTIPHILKLENHPDPAVRAAVAATVMAVP